MDPAQLQTIIVAVASLLIFGGVGGAVAIMAREAHMAGRRRARLQGEQAIASTAGLTTRALSSALQSAGRVGSRMATRDPAQLSALRTRLIRSGFLSREAVAVYLGVRVVALVAATVVSA